MVGKKLLPHVGNSREDQENFPASSVHSLTSCISRSSTGVPCRTQIIRCGHGILRRPVAKPAASTMPGYQWCLNVGAIIIVCLSFKSLLCEFLAKQQARVKQNDARKCGNYSDLLPLKAARHDNISNWGFKSELQTNPMPFHLQSLWGATLMPRRGCAMDWDKTIQ